MLPALVLLALSGCRGDQPDFREAYGTVDEPCAATNAGAHCTAHVYLINHGGDGLGHATIVVPLTNTTVVASPARTVSAATCDVSIPDTSAGAAVELRCEFDLPLGKAIESAPSLQNLDFSAAAGSNFSASSLSGLATFALALVAAVVAVVALLAAIQGRRPILSRAPGAPPPPDNSSDDDGTDW